MKIISLYKNRKIKSFNDLFNISGSINRLVAVSAYIDTESIAQLIELLSKKGYSKPKPTLQIFTDKSSSRFSSDRLIRKNLLELNEKIQSSFSKDSGIYLVQYGKLFHSKLYLIEGNKNGKVLLGSMNLTQKGLNENEEILFHTDYTIGSKAYANSIANDADEYISQLFKQNKDSKISPELKENFPSTMRAFLLDASVYYKLSEQDPFRFKLYLPEQISKQQADIDPLLEASIKDSVSLETLITRSKIAGGLELDGDVFHKKGKNRSNWKKYCIETCFGFWNPTNFRELLEEELEKREKSRKPFYDSLASIIKNEEYEKQLTDIFIKLCGRINAYLETENIHDWKFKNPDDALKAWTTWYSRLKLKLDNEKVFNRLVSGIASAPSPDVWNDPLSSGEYEESFFQNILYNWSKEYSKTTTNIVAQAIAWNLGLEDPEVKESMDHLELKERIETWLIENPTKNLMEFNYSEYEDDDEDYEE